MEALGASLAVASLTIQLVDGVDRFQTFFEECRDPTISIHDLITQLDAVCQLLEIIERKATKPGGDSALTGATSLKDELGRSKSKLQELTNLITKFEAGLSHTAADRCRGRIRVKNYLKLHAQQKRIRRYAEKLDRTRATLLDYFNITLMASVSEIQVQQQSIMSSKIIDLQDDTEVSNALIVPEKCQSFPLQQPMGPGVSTAAKAPNPTPKLGNNININHEAGFAMMNISNSQTVTNSQAGAKNVMFQQKFTTRAKTTQQVPEPVAQHPEETATRTEEPSSEPTQHTWTRKECTITINNTSSDGMAYNGDNHQELHMNAGENIMFEQNLSTDE